MPLRCKANRTQLRKENLMDTVIEVEYVDHHREYDGYEDLLVSIRKTFGSANGPLFTTNTPDLWPVFLANIPEHARQHYTCNACRHFVERFGGLVRISEDGTKTPAMWSDVSEFFTPAVNSIKKLIAKSKVNGIFVSSLLVYGEPVTGEWHHMAVTPPASTVWKSLTQGSNQRAAEKNEDFKTLMNGLIEYKIEAVTQAVKLLKSDQLYRSEKVLGVAEWLFDLHTKRNATMNTAARENITWLAVATAPAGFCHVKSSMIGTLLDDIVAGMDYDDVSRRFAAKMHPLQYQRPQAAPSTGNISQAEKIMQQLNASEALNRRFARLEELQLIWKPSEQKAESPSEGVFSHLKPKNDNPEVKEIDGNPVTITWDKFSKTILPDVISMEFFADTRQDYSAITTAARDEAPPILQWDTEEKRNPFAWYFKNGVHSPAEWNLSRGWVKVTGICLSPTMWQGNFSHHQSAVHFIVDGCRDTNYQRSGNAIFPETLKAEFHGIRSTIEAYSRNAKLDGYDSSSACGVRCGAGQSWNLLIRVKSKYGVTSYRLDRWD